MLPPAFHGMPTPAGVQRFRFVGDEMQNRVMALPRRLDDGHLKTVGDALAAVIGMHEDAGQPWGEILALMIVSHYRIIGLDTPGDSSNWRGNAEIYR